MEHVLSEQETPQAAQIMRNSQKKWNMKEEVRMKERTNNKAIVRKAIGLLACLAMVAAMLPVNVAKATSTNGPVIDTSKKGSITIHKYEYNGTEASPSPTPVAGNGQAGQTIPDGAVPLQGAGFTIYKVEDAAMLDTYYGINSTGLPDASNYYTGTDGNYTVDSQYTPAGTETTDEYGVATFGNLELGLYLVVETTIPDKVTTPIVPFLVSIPMTTYEGNDWLYDVHVYPKNKTTYGGVSLKKTGNSSAALEGVTFVLQKKDDSGVYQTVTTDDKGKPVGTAGTLTTGADGIITVEDLSPGEYRFIETGIGANYGYILDGVTAYTFTISDDGAITYGSTPTITAGSDTYINVVNKKPDVTKQVLNNAPTPTPVKEADYSVGDTVSYKITVNVPSNIESLRVFQVRDTPTNLKFTAGTLRVYRADGTTEIANSTYTITDNSPVNGFTVDFDTTVTAGIKDSAGADIIITYDAVLQNGAVTTKDGNANTVDLVYEDKILPANRDDGNPNPTAEPTPTAIYEIEDSATVYTFKMTINKTGEGNTGLANVKFDLYKEDSNGTVTGDDASALGLDRNKKWTKIESLTTNSSGEVSTTQGLANGIYYLVETETNEGYNLLSKPVKVELEAVYTTSFKTTSTGEHKTIKNEIDTASNTLTEKMSVNDTEQNSLTVNIKNSKGFTLPTTGGAGGFLFTLIGCCIMILGIIMFRRTRNKQAAN